MGIFGALRKLLPTRARAPATSPEHVDVAAWRSRLFAAQKLAEYEWPVWQKLENAVDGLYPALIATDGGDTFAGTPYEGRFRSGDQLDVNLMGRALRKRSADFFDRFPSLKFSRRPSTDSEVVDEAERLVEKLMDEGGAVYEAKRGMELAHTRGQTIVWPMFVRDRISESEIVAGKTPVGAFVESVLAGNPPDVPVGADYAGISQAAKIALSPVDKAGNTNPHFFALTERQRADLLVLQMRADKMDRKSRAAPHAIQPRAKIYFECTPYATWCLTDASVTDYSKATYVARKIVMTPEEFQQDPSFTDEAKAEVRPIPLPKSDGGAPVADSTFTMSSDGRHVADEAGRVVIWEIWDKIGWRRIWLADGYDKPVGKSTRYPYMDLFGRPLFPDFFPCVWRTPWSRMRESPARVLGLPGLEPMWAPAIEYIRCVSAFVIACKSTARIFVVGPGVSKDSLTAVARAQDCTYVEMSTETYTAAMGDPSKQFTQLPMSPAPLDYLNAAEKVKHEAFESVHLSAASMTSSPQAGTATQEVLIGQGANTVEGDIRGCFEDAYAELAWKALLMFLEFANPQEFEAYLGARALEPRASREAPTVDPETGDSVAPQLRPSIYEALTQMDLVGERLECRFAASTRAADAMRIKTLEDILATVNNVRDSTGMPYKDPRDIIDRLLKEADVEASDYQPTEAEIAVRVAAMMQERAGGPDGGNDGGAPDHSDNRRARGERGTPASPGRRSRDRGPLATANAGGVEMRRATAAS